MKYFVLALCLVGCERPCHDEARVLSLGIGESIICDHGARLGVLRPMEDGRVLVACTCGISDGGR